MTPRSVSALLFAAGLAPTASASWPTSPKKFQHWFRSFDVLWFQDAEQQCLTEIHNYHHDIQTGRGSLCSAVLTCLMDNSAESIKMNVASAQVLLGMIPAILSYIGSDLLELAVLSTHRPLLAILISMGAPALQVPRVFSSFNVASIVNQQASVTVEAYYQWLWARPKVWQTLITCGIYIVAAAAVVNNVHTAIFLDQRTVVVWRCSNVNMPLAWAVMGIGPAVITIGAVAQQYRLPTFPTLSCGWKMADISLRHDAAEDSRRAALLAKPDHWAPRKWLSAMLFSLAALAALIQLIFGTAILSAVAPVSFFDTLPIVMRFTLSSLICRAVLLLELDGIRLEIQKSIVAQRNTTQ